MKKVLSLFLILSMMFTLASCGQVVDIVEDVVEKLENVENKQEDVEVKTENKVEDLEGVTNSESNVNIEFESDTEKETEFKEEMITPENSGNTFLTQYFDESGKSAEDVALAYVRYMRNEEYDKVKSLLSDTELKFLSGAEIYDVLLRNDSDMLKITDKDALIEVEKSNVNDGRCTVYITLRTLDSNYDTILFECSIPMEMTEDNLWKVRKLDDFAIQNFGIVIPKGCTLSIDGVEVNRDTDVTIRPYEDNIDLEVLVFENIGMKEKVLTVKSPVFEVTASVTPERDDKNVKPLLEVSEELVLKANEYIKTITPVLMNSASAGTLTLEETQKYLSQDMPEGRDVEIFTMCDSEVDTYFNNKYRNINVTQVIPHLTEKSQWVSNDSFYLPMGMSMTWEDPGVSTGQPKWTPKSSDKYADIVLQYVNGEFKIMDVNPKLDNYTSGLWSIFDLNYVTDDF